MAFDLNRVFKTLLFASPGSLSVKDIQTVFTRFHEEAAALLLASPEGADADDEGAPAGPTADEVPSLVTATQIREAMTEISHQLEATHEVFRLQETHNGWRLVAAVEGAEWVRLLRNQPRPVKLSQSALETLAIIAYRQPVTRAEIEAIRGVSVESPINRLQERDLIRITGRAELPGRPIQYGTTEIFLEFVGLRSLDELPASDVLSAREIDAWLNRASEPQAVTDREVGLDTETGDEQADLELEPEEVASENGHLAVAPGEAASVEPPPRDRVETPPAPS